MKKIDWLLALLIIAIGVVCLAASATSYRGMMPMGHRRGGMMAGMHGYGYGPGFWFSGLLFFAVLLLIVIVVLLFIWFWRKRR